MKTSISTHLLLLAVIAASPSVVRATTFWQPTTTTPYLPANNPNFTAPYVWGADTFALNNPGGPVEGSTLIGQPVQITPLSIGQGGDQPVPIWTGSSAFQYQQDTSTPNGGSNDGMITYNTSSSAGIMAWMPTTYPVDKALNEAPTYQIVSAQSAVKFGSNNTVDVGMIGNPGGTAIRTQSTYVAGCTFEYDMGSIWLSVTNNGDGTAAWSLEARETVPTSHSIAPSSADVMLAGSAMPGGVLLTGIDNSAWYLMQTWYNYSTNTLSAQLVDSSGENLLPPSADNIFLEDYTPDIQGYGFQVDGGQTESEDGRFSFNPPSSSNGETSLDNFAAVPEPSSFVLAGFAAAGLCAAAWRRRSNRRILAAAIA